MDQRKIFKTLEIIWLISAGLCVFVTVYFLITKETDSALYFFFMFLISGIMYALRRYQRKRQEEGWKSKRTSGTEEIKETQGTKRNKN